MSFIFDNSGLFLKTFQKYGITSALRINHFLSQTSHESGNFTRLVENLNYSPEGLANTVPFNTKLTTAQKNLYGRTSVHPANQQMIANIGYANSNGNGNVASGEGWKFRARSFIGLTGRANYEAYKKYSGYDVVKNPDLLLQNDIAIDCAGWFWAVYKNLNPLADANQIIKITEKINGKQNGLSDRIVKYNFYKSQNITLDLLKKKAKPLPNFSSISSYAFNWLSPFNTKNT